MTLNWGKIGPALLVGAGFLAYANSFSVPFVFDDRDSIVESPHIRKPWPPSEWFSAPWATAADGRPVVALSFTLNYALDRLNPRAWHAVNLAVHLTAGLCLFGIFRRLLRLPPLAARWAAAADGVALAAALLWLLHPLQTESVTYIGTRTESFMGCFYLLSLFAFLRGVESPGREAACSGSRVRLPGHGPRRSRCRSPWRSLASIASSFPELGDPWLRRQGFYVLLACL